MSRPTPAQLAALRRIADAGEVGAGQIDYRTLAVLRLSGWIVDCERMYFGPRTHRVKLTVDGKRALAAYRERRLEEAKEE